MGTAASGYSYKATPLRATDLSQRLQPVFFNLDLFTQALAEPIYAFANPVSGLLESDPQTTCKREVELNYIMQGSLKIYGVAARSCMARPPSSSRVYMCEFEDDKLCSTYMPYHALQVNIMCALGGLGESVGNTFVTMIQVFTDYGVYYFSALTNCAITGGDNCSLQGVPAYPHAAVDVMFCNAFEMLAHSANVFTALTRGLYAPIYEAAQYDETLGGNDVPNCIGLSEDVCVTRGVGFFEDYLYPYARPCKRSGGCFCAWIKQKGVNDFDLFNRATSVKEVRDETLQSSYANSDHAFCASACSLITVEEDCGEKSSILDPFGQCSWRDGRCLSHRDNLQKYPIEAGISTLFVGVFSFPLHVVHITNQTLAQAIDLTTGDTVEPEDDPCIASEKNKLQNCAIPEGDGSVSAFTGSFTDLGDGEGGGKSGDKGGDKGGGKGGDKGGDKGGARKKAKALKTQLKSTFTKPPKMSIVAMLRFIMWYRDILVAFLELMRSFDVVLSGVQSPEYEEFQEIVFTLVDILQKLIYVYQDIIARTWEDIVKFIVALMQLFSATPNNIEAAATKLLLVIVKYVAFLANMFIDFIIAGPIGQWLTVILSVVCAVLKYVMIGMDAIIDGICDVVGKIPLVSAGDIGICPSEASIAERQVRYEKMSQCGLGSLSTSTELIPAMEATVCSVTIMRPIEEIRVDDIYNVKDLFEYVREAQNPDFGTLGCENCVVTHPDQCQWTETWTREDGTQETRKVYKPTVHTSRGAACPCEFCSHKHQEHEPIGDAHENGGFYHCNAGTGYCQCGPAPGQLLAEARLPTQASNGQVKEDVVCPGGRSIKQVERKDHLTPAYKTHNALCYIREAWRCDADRIHGASYRWTDPDTGETFDVTGDDHYGSSQCEKVYNAHCVVNGNNRCVVGSTEFTSDIVETARIERTRCAVHRCLTYSKDVELEGPYLCREFCDPHPFNEDNVLNEAYYRWTEEPGTPSLVHWRFDRSPFNVSADGDKLEFISDDPTIYNPYASRINDEDNWNRQIDIWNRAATRARDERLSSYCVCDVGYRDTPVRFNEHLIPTGEETTGRSTTVIDYARNVFQGAPPQSYLFMGEGTDAFAHVKSAVERRTHHVDVGRRRTLLQDRAARKQSAWFPEVNTTAQAMGQPSATCARDTDCTNSTKNNSCFEADGPVPCNTRCALTARCDPHLRVCTCSSTTLERATKVHSHPDRERLDTVRSIETVMRDSNAWQGTTYCDKLMRGYTGSDVGRLSVVELLSLRRCAVARLAAARVAAFVDVPTLPRDLFYNPWTSLKLVEDIVVGSVMYSRMVEKHNDTDAVWTALRQKDIDPLLVHRVIRVGEDVVAWLSDGARVRNAVNTTANALAPIIGEDLAKKVEELVGRSLVTADEILTGSTMSELDVRGWWKTTNNLVGKISDDIHAAKQTGEYHAYQERTNRKRPEPTVVQSDAAGSKTRRNLLQDTVVPAANECKVADIIIENTVGAVENAIHYYTATYPIQLCLFMLEFTELTPTSDGTIANFVFCDTVAEAHINPACICVRELIDEYQHPAHISQQDSLWGRVKQWLENTWTKYNGSKPADHVRKVGKKTDRSTTTAFVKGLSAISGLDITYQIDKIAAELSDHSVQNAADAFNDYYVCKMDKVWNAGEFMRVNAFEAMIGSFIIVTVVVAVWKYVIGVGNVWVTMLAMTLFFPLVMLIVYDLEAGCSVQHPNPFAWIPWIGQGAPATVPFIPTRFADDLYTALDEHLLPDEYLTVFDSVVIRHAPGPNDRGSRGAIRKVYDCASEPYRFDDGIRVMLYYVARNYPTWKHTTPRWFAAGVKNTFVGRVLDSYNATFIQSHKQLVLDSKNTDSHIPSLDDCARVSAYVHMIPTVVIILLTVGLIPSFVFLLLKAVVLLPLTQSSALRWFSYNARETNAVIYEAAEQVAVQNAETMRINWEEQDGVHNNYT